MDQERLPRQHDVVELARQQCSGLVATLSSITTPLQVLSNINFCRTLPNLENQGHETYS